MDVLLGNLDLRQLHFLRPLWLLTLPVVLGLWWDIRQRNLADSANPILPGHLADALSVGGQKTTRWLPVDSIALALVFGALAIAGPSYRQMPAPWFTEEQPVVVGLEVSDSMRSNDVLPSRLERSRIKLLELLAQRTGARTSLIAYDGSAHLVVPPTKDREVIKPFLESLDPMLMPVKGTDLAALLETSKTLMTTQTQPGVLLLITDGLVPTDAQAIDAFVDGRRQLIVYVVGTQAGGIALMPDGAIASNKAGGRVDTQVPFDVIDDLASRYDLTVIRQKKDSSDIPALVRAIRSSAAAVADPDAQWQDEAWWLLWPMAGLLLISFRRGWRL